MFCNHGCMVVFGFNPIIFLFFFVVGIVLFIFGFHYLKLKRLIENIPTSKIRSIAMGLVEIFGEVETMTEHTLKSPFTWIDCVYYRYKIEEYRQSGKGGGHWFTIKSGDESMLFYLKDETGKVIIDSRGAKIVLSKDNRFQSGFGKDPPASAMPFLKKHNVRYEGMLFGINKKMRYTEWFIQPKDKLYVMGTASDNPYVEDASVESGVEDVMIQKGKHQKMYYISDKSERGVISSFMWKAYGATILGSILIILGIITLSMYLI